MRDFLKSLKLANVCYDIRGPVHERATIMEEEGHRILKLNIGNPAPFGFEAPEEILVDVIHNIPKSQGYCDSRGLYSARKAVMQYAQQIQIPNVEVNDIYLGNGVSELIVMVTPGRALPSASLIRPCRLPETVLCATSAPAPAVRARTISARIRVLPLMTLPPRGGTNDSDAGPPWPGSESGTMELPATGAAPRRGR